MVNEFDAAGRSSCGVAVCRGVEFGFLDSRVNPVEIRAER